MNSVNPYSTEFNLLPPKYSIWLVLGLASLALILGAGVAFGIYMARVVTMLAVLGLIFMIVAIGRPDISVMVFTFVLYLNLSAVLVEQGLPSIAKPFVALLVVIVLIRWLVFKDRIAGIAKPLLYVGVYTALGAISLFFADDFTAALAGLNVYLKDAVICFLIVALLQDRGVFVNVVRGLLLAGIIMGGLALIQQLTGSPSSNFLGFAKVVSDSTYGSRMAGSIGDPNYFAQSMVVLLPLAIDRFFAERRAIFRLLAVLALGVCSFTVIYSYSRGAFLAAVIAMAFYMVRRRPNPTQLVFVVLAFLLIYQFLPANYTSRISTLFDFLPGNGSALSDSSFRGRSSENQVAIDMFMDNPILGVGLGNYNQKYQEYSRSLGLDFRNTARSAHSLYLEILAERGLFGVASFFVLLYYTFVTLRACEDRFLRAGLTEASGLAFAMMASFAAYLVTAMFLHDAFIRYFWLLLGLAWSVPQLSGGAEAQVNARRHL